MFLTTAYNEVIYRPLLNLLVGSYHLIPDVGVAIILITGLIRLALAPSFGKSLKSQQAMSDLQPKLDQLREQHKDNREAQAKAMMDLYREHKINPLSSCLPLLVQLPVLIALYQVFGKALKSDLSGLYPFVSNPGHLDPRFLHLVDLSQPSWIFAIIAGLSQLWQGWLMLPKTKTQDPTARAIQLQTTYLLPAVSVFIAWKLPAGLPLYWIATTLFTVAQQYYIKRTHRPPAAQIV